MMGERNLAPPSCGVAHSREEAPPQQAAPHGAGKPAAPPKKQARRTRTGLKRPEWDLLLVCWGRGEGPRDFRSRRCALA